MEHLWNAVVLSLGLHAKPEDLTFLQISLRAVIIFICTLVMIRLGHKRSLSRKTAFDSVLIVLLAAILARAINGAAAFFPTIGGAFVLVGLHRLVAWTAYHSHTFGCLVKGSADIVVENGQFVSAQMSRNSVTRRDIEEDMRLSAKIADISAVHEARIERSGDISFITSDATKREQKAVDR
jgi:uncharacterized membrane protein YcaP (DUF421 family)